MTYSVKEIFFTLQGEGHNAGTAAVFCRFTGCNLWTGREAQRVSAICQFCDTDFVGVDGPGGGRFTNAEELANAVESAWRPSDEAERFVVCTGGEPLLQLDTPLIEALQIRGFRVAIETNGTLDSPGGIDWVCVSPKANTTIKLTKGDELKFVFPQFGVKPSDYEHLEFDHFFLQPMDGPARQENTQLAVEYCMANPRWRLSLQTHKYLGIP